MTDSTHVDPEEAYYRRNRALKVLGLVLALCLACGIGACLGGGLIFGLTQAGNLLTQDQASVPLKTIEVEKRVEEIEKESGTRTRSGGVVIVEVIADSPAETAGLQEGDLIIAVDGQELGPGWDLAAAIGGYEPADRVVLELERPSEGRKSLPVTLGRHPDRKGAAYLGVGYADASRGALPEPRMAPLPHLEEFDLDHMPFALPEGGVLQGALVVQVTEGSPAAAAGLTDGDVITAVDSEPIEGPEALSAAVAAHMPGDSVTLTVFRMGDGQEQEIKVKLAEHPDGGGRGFLGVTISGLFRMEQFGDPSAPGQFHFRHGQPGYEFHWDEMPFNWEEMPFDPGNLPFNWEEMPFDPGNLPFNWEEMPFNRENLPFDLDELPMEPEDWQRHLQLDDRSA